MIKRIPKNLSAIFAISILAACGAKAPTTASVNNDGPWSLNGGKSQVSFVTIKKGTIAEAHDFKSISGDVAADGGVKLAIVLDSVRTNIDSRDSRMRQFLFETDKTPFAEITASPDLAKYRDLAIGARVEDELTINVNMHGMSQSYEAQVYVTRSGPNSVSVDSKLPLLVSADEFGFEAGVEKLRELANLPSITPMVPVSFSLLFES